MAGLLDAGYADLSNPRTLQGLLAQFQPSLQDIAAANRRAQLQFFLGLLGAPKGAEFERIGESGQPASLQGHQQYLDNSQLQRLRALQLGGSALDLLNKRFQYNDAMLLR